MFAEIKEKLKTGKTILYPTDTVWGIGCDATNIEAVQKVYQLKNRAESKSLIILVDSVEMLK
ncbi:L-threonylcarbamoyladenylate synthase, partial [Tenacibaculum finnmarkense]